MPEAKARPRARARAVPRPAQPVQQQPQPEQAKAKSAPVAPVAPAAPTGQPSPAPLLHAPALSAFCDMLMGDSGTGKTSLLATFIAWVWQRYRKVTLFYSCDPGGWPTSITKLIQLGICLPFRLRTRDPDDRYHLAFETCLRAAQGYWPTEFVNPAKGEVAPQVSLVSPISQVLRMYCPQGHVVRQVGAEGQLKGQYVCAPDGDKSKCGQVVSMDQGAKVERDTFRTPGLEDAGAVVYDGITSMCAWAMMDLQDRGANVQAGEKDALRSAIRIESGGLHFGSSTIAHYGQVQSLAERLLNVAASIPFLVARPVWTALEKKATDDRSGTIIYGPDLPGSAKTAVVPQWVGNLLGTCWTTNEKGEREYRLYLTRYQLPGETVPHLCKTRVSPGYLEEYLTDGPVDEFGKPKSGNPPFTNLNLGKFYDLEEAALQAELDLGKVEFADAPGLTERKVGAAKVEDVGTGQLRQVRASAAPSAPTQAPAQAQAQAAASTGRPRAQAPTATKAPVQPPLGQLVPPAGAKPQDDTAAQSDDSPAPPEETSRPQAKTRAKSSKAKASKADQVKADEKIPF